MARGAIPSAALSDRDHWRRSTSLPRIPDELTGPVLFLYATEEGALSGDDAGGTAFMTQHRGPDGRPHEFIVTAGHVIANGARVVRFNARAGGVDVLPTEDDDWTRHPDGDDIAVIRYQTVVPPGESIDDAPEATVWPLDWDAWVATDQWLSAFNVGVGDLVFMLGRFLRTGKGAISQPLARFGNVAMVPGVKVRDGRGLDVEARLIEMRSLSGYSGSPVFLYLGPGTYRGNGTIMKFFEEHIRLIGVDAGHLPLTASVRDDMGSTGLTVGLNSGMALVVPHTKVAETVAHFWETRDWQDSAGG